VKTRGSVQDCGCIALPEAVQEQTGLYPGATFSIEVTPNGGILLIPLEPRAKSDIPSGTKCG
jgi:hypothetical protein